MNRFVNNKWERAALRNSCKLKVKFRFGKPPELVALMCVWYFVFYCKNIFQVHEQENNKQSSIGISVIRVLKFWNFAKRLLDIGAMAAFPASRYLLKLRKLVGGRRFKSNKIVDIIVWLRVDSIIILKKVVLVPQVFRSWHKYKSTPYKSQTSLYCHVNENACYYPGFVVESTFLFSACWW